MKIGVSSIFRDHIASLYDARTSRVSIFDMLLFYVSPIILAGLAYWSGFDVAVDAYNVSITFFGIFIALLLNIQVAVFSIFQRKWERPADARVAQSQDNILKVRRTLLVELNANISYLILVCCLALVAVLVFYVQRLLTGIPPAFCVFIYAHFLLTLVMIVKRSHALFQKEYRDSPQ